MRSVILLCAVASAVCLSSGGEQVSSSSFVFSGSSAYDFVFGGGAGFTANPLNSIRSGNPGQHSIASFKVALSPGIVIEHISFEYSYTVGFGSGGKGTNFTMRAAGADVYASPLYNGNDHPYSKAHPNYSQPIAVDVPLSIKVPAAKQARIEFDFDCNDRNIQLLLPLKVTVTCTGGPCNAPAPKDTRATKYSMTDALAANGAACLDGSPGAYYHLPGEGTGANKWYIHHEGGGWCESLDDCLGRSGGNLGSSKAYPAKADLGGGYFDTNALTNPMMYNWNHVYMKYCDGGSFSGNNETTQSYKGKTLFWRGKRIREAISADLFAKRGLGKATDVIVSGCSAGGLATFLHTDQWCDAVKAKSGGKCAGLPDSGFFLDYQDPNTRCTPESDSAATDLLGNTVQGDYHCGLKWTYSIQNATAGINQDCVKAHTADSTEWKCMFAEHSSEHIRAPLFAMQSEYDAWQTTYVMHNRNLQTLGDNITSRIQSMLMKNNNESGAFLDSCHHHCGEWNKIRIDGDLVSSAIQKWYDGIGKAGNKVLWNQNKPYPCAACCAP